MKKQALAALAAVAILALASCASMQGTGGNDDMDHGEKADAGEEHPGLSREMEAASRQAVMPDGEYSDRAFIDEMVPHHEGAVQMAEVALDNAEHEEIKMLAEDIISSQRAEIETLGEIRDRRFGSAGDGMNMEGMDEEMEGMGMTDPEELASSNPFDQAFIDAMIPHHESAVVMAEVARKETEDQEIESLAEDIVSAQRREIEQMNEWRESWYPRG